jgi:hypothetical protein
MNQSTPLGYNLKKTCHGTDFVDFFQKQVNDRVGQAHAISSDEENATPVSQSSRHASQSSSHASQATSKASPAAKKASVFAMVRTFSGNQSYVHTTIGKCSPLVSKFPPSGELVVRKI